MSSPREYQTEAVIIWKTKLGEADRILTLYTPGLGKVRAVAKGVRRPRSKLAGHLELLTHSLVSLARGKNLDVIIGSQAINSFFGLKNDLDRTSCALYAAELVDQFTVESVESPPLFRLLLDTLARLEQPGNTAIALRYFEVNMLSEAGYRPQLHKCVKCHRTLTPVLNSFCPGLGGVLCPDCRPPGLAAYPISVNALKVLRLLETHDYATASRLQLAPELSAELERLLRSYIRYQLERELKSTAWLDTLNKEA